MYKGCKLLRWIAGNLCQLLADLFQLVESPGPHTVQVGCKHYSNLLSDGASLQEQEVLLLGAVVTCNFYLADNSYFLGPATPHFSLGGTGTAK
jgi:hypothetical protein